MNEANEKYLCIICGNTVMLMAKGTEPLSCCGQNMTRSPENEDISKFDFSIKQKDKGEING